MSFTLAQLRTKAKRRADMENGTLVSDSEWLDYINESVAELHDLLTTLYADYHINTSTFTTVSGTSSYNLPTDFLKMKGVDAKLNGSEYENVRKWSFEDRNKMRSGSELYYRILGSTIELVPTPTSTVDFRLWYVPVATKLASDSDTVSDWNQWSEFVVVSAAIKAMIKEESDPKVLLMQKAELKQRINDSASLRDENEVEVITDVYGDYEDC